MSLNTQNLWVVVETCQVKRTIPLPLRHSSLSNIYTSSFSKPEIINDFESANNLVKPVVSDFTSEFPPFELTLPKMNPDFPVLEPRYMNLNKDTQIKLIGIYSNSECALAQLNKGPNRCILGPTNIQ